MMLYFSHFLVKNNTSVHLCSVWFSPQEIKRNLKYHMCFIKIGLTEERIPESRLFFIIPELCFFNSQYSSLENCVTWINWQMKKREDRLKSQILLMSWTRP